MTEIKYLNKENSINDLLTYPSIKKFSKFILPLEWAYNLKTKLKDIDCLLPYHQNIKVNSTLTAINYIIDSSEKGKKIFYDIYNNKEKREDNSKQDTGLFFFKGKENAPFTIINAGGAFSYVGSIHEGFPYAMELNKKDYNAFVLQYRIGNGYKATQDLARAITFIFENNHLFKVNLRNYSVWGSSAGARMAAAIGSKGVEIFGGKNLPKPKVVVMLYTGQTSFTMEDPPTFVAVGENDRIANPKAVENRVNEMKKVGLKVEFHKYSNVGHGFGLGIGTSAENWVEDAIRFWEEQK